MEREPKPYNPYEGMNREELYGVLRDLQMYQRELTLHTSLIQSELTKLYAAELGRPNE